MNESKAPFGIGQKVVCVDAKNLIGGLSKSSFLPVEGHLYTVQKCKRHCCGWSVDIGATSNIISGYVECNMCGSLFYDASSVRWFGSNRFAPYDPPRLEIPAELLEVTEERIDCKPEVKEVV